jgi:hypothetical protein
VDEGGELCTQTMGGVVKLKAQCATEWNRRVEEHGATAARHGIDEATSADVRM